MQHVPVHVYYLSVNAVLVLTFISIHISVEIYGRMSTDLLPTPAKSHYVFNLRDLSKCVQGQ